MIRKIKIAGISDNLLITPEHRVLAIQTIRCPYNKKNRKSFELCYGRCSHSSRPKCIYQNYKAKWIPAKNLKVGDFLVYCHSIEEKKKIKYLSLEKELKEEIKNQRIIKIGNFLYGTGRNQTNKLQRNPRAKKIPVKLNLTSLFARICGYYIAEGSTSRNSLSFAFNIKEEEYINDIVSFFKNSQFNLKTRIDKRIDDNTTQLQIFSTPLKFLFEKWFGKGATNKKLPWFFNLMDKKFQFELLKGLFRGDGCIWKNAVYLSSTSKILLLQIRNFLIQNKIPVLFYVSNRKKEGYIKGRRVNLHPSFQLIARSPKLDFWNKQEFFSTPTLRFYNQIKDKETWLRVKNIEEVPYNNLVYNIEIKDDKSYTSEFGTLHNCAYTWDRRHITRIKPHGIVSFSRGLKADIIIADDLLSDPSSPIHPTVILKVGEIFRSVILESLKPGGEIHVVGSALSRADFYFDPEIQKKFHTKFYPAITKDNQDNEISAWPEFYTLEQLKEKIPVMGERNFAAEMMMEPYYSTDSFFKKEQLRKDIVNPQLRNIKLVQGLDTSNLVIAGLDIGRKKHPAAFEVFEIRDRKAIQIHRKIMKGWPYYNGKSFDPFHPTQVEYCREAIKNFGINYLYFDATRGEFLGAQDSGLLSMHFIPIIFVPKMRIQMATEFEKAVLNKQLELFDDEEMLDSICGVTNDLISIETASGSHGDEFWAVALALIGLSKFGTSGAQDKEIRVGSPSIFDDKKLPKGW